MKWQYTSLLWFMMWSEEGYSKDYKMPGRPLITFEYVIQNFEDEQQGGDIMQPNGPARLMPSLNSSSMTELNNNHIVEQNSGLHQIKIVRSNSNVGGGVENHKTMLTSPLQQQYNYNNQIKNNISTTEIWHHGPR